MRSRNGDTQPEVREMVRSGGAGEGLGGTPCESRLKLTRSLSDSASGFEFASVY